MHITILGSGTILSDNRNPSGYLIQNQNQMALLDCGPGNLHRLLSLNVDPLSLSAIFLSHFHIDHYSDVLPVLMRRYLKNPQINRKLTVFGPRNLKYWYATQSKLHGSWFSDYKPKLIELYKDELQWAGLKVSSFPTLHLEHSIAYKFEAADTSFFYGGDTDYDKGLVAFARDTDLAILECSHRDEKPLKGHLTPAKVARFINNARIAKTVITHIYPENDTDDLSDRIKNYTDKDIEIAFDFMELELRHF